MKKYSGSFLRVRNLEKYQHYKDRNPPWIKLHQELLEDYDFGRLQDASKAHAICIMLLASRLDNRIPADPEWIAKKISATGKIDLEALLSLSFLEMYQDASNTLATCEQSACLEESRAEESRAETEREKARSAQSELDWRIAQTWDAHLAQWRGFHEDVDGRAPGGPPPTMVEEIREAIIRSLRLFDKHLLGPENRERWLAESKTLAAGIGLYLDTWCTARHKDNQLSAGGKRYLEHWRPWKKLHNKPDPVEKFSELYFQAKTARGAA